MDRHTQHMIEITAGALLVIAFAYVVFMCRGTHAPAAAAPIVLPKLTAQEQTTIARSQGFQVLISYTDRGFQPSTATVHPGDTVRFTNNSSRDLRVEAHGNLYPGTSDCGASAFDSCTPVSPKHFWEFTFDKAGTWNFINALNPQDLGTVTTQ
jgi:plastocyanin